MSLCLKRPLQLVAVLIDHRFICSRRILFQEILSTRVKAHLARFRGKGLCVVHVGAFLH